MQNLESVWIKTTCWVDTQFCGPGIVCVLSDLIAVKYTQVTMALEYSVIHLEVRHYEQLSQNYRILW